MNMTPWFHRGGIHSGGPCPTLYAGGEVVILRDFAPRRCLEYAQRYRLTFLIGVPTILSMLARMQERIHADLSSLKGIVTMGAPFERAACEKYRQLLTPNIFNGYGTTETFWNTFLRPGRPAGAWRARRAAPARMTMCGWWRSTTTGPAPSRRRPCRRTARHSGEILISCAGQKHLLLLQQCRAAARARFYKGWMYTGDMGTWDGDGFVTVTGRKDDMIVSAGENIYPVQIEEVLNAHPQVAESAVVGIPDRLRGEAVAAYVVPADDSLTVDELKEILPAAVHAGLLQVAQGLPSGEGAAPHRHRQADALQAAGGRQVTCPDIPEQTKKTDR